MTYAYGLTSIKRLNTCHPDIIKIMKRALVMSKVDITIVCGGRNEAMQEAAFAANKSKAHYGESPHNTQPVSLAVDIAPFFEQTIAWNDKELFAEVAKAVHAAQKELFNEGKITHLLENGFEKWGWDAPHWQILGWKRIK